MSKERTIMFGPLRIEGFVDMAGGMMDLERLAKTGVPTEYVEGEWVARRPDGGESAASIWLDGSDGWCWRALGKSGTAESYAAARSAASEVLEAYLYE